MNDRMPAFALASPAFADGASMPAVHAKPKAGGRDVSVPLRWGPAPAGTESFAIEVVDLHPVARRWVHWLVVDIPSDVLDLPPGASGTDMPAGSCELDTSYGTGGWGGPNPPVGTGPHDYHITVFALDTPTLGLPDRVSLDEFREALAPHAIAAASIVGTFER